MKSRMEKYYESQQSFGKRTERNEVLYNEINKGELEDFKIDSNAKVIKSNVNDIDLNNLRDILDKKYADKIPQRKSIFIEEIEEEKNEEKFETKEYDINAILEKARENKETNYEEERFKKINNTQFDILKNLSFDSKPEVLEEDSPEENLMTLINTITAKELEQTSNLNPLDIFTDLKGSDDTVVIPPQKEEKSELEDTMSIDTSFYTTKSNFDKTDFEGFNDDEEGSGSKVLVGILITLAVVALAIGILIILNKYLNLGLF